MEGLTQQIEAILFAAARVVSKEELMSFCCASEEEIKKAVAELESKLNESNSSLMITKEDTGWKISVREKYTAPLRNIVPNTELSRSILETLAVIAWKQPVMQAEVIDIRTTKAYEHIGELEKLGFITKQKHGRSFILKTSQKFADYFDLPKKEAVDAIFKNVSANKGPQKKIDEVPSMEVYVREDAKREEQVGEFEIYEETKQKPIINPETKEEFYEKNDEETPKDKTQKKESSSEKEIYVDLSDKTNQKSNQNDAEEFTQDSEETLALQKNTSKEKKSKTTEGRKLDYELEELIDEDKQKKEKKEEPDEEEYSEENE